MASIQLSFSAMAISRLQHQHGLRCKSPVTASNSRIDLFSVSGQNFHLKLKASSIRSASLSEGRNFPLHNGSVRHASQGNFVNECVEQSTGVKGQLDTEFFRTLRAEIASNTSGFFFADDEFDLDRPTVGFSSISEAIEDIRQGRMVIVVDDEERENEGGLIMAASVVTPESMAFIVKHGTGIVCVSMKGEDLERLKLPLMVSQNENDEKLTTAFTVSVLDLIGWKIWHNSRCFSS